MLSETLRQRPLFSEQRQAKINAPTVIDNAVRNLVLAMRMYETQGAMDREQVETCVLRAFENAEFMYYGLDKDSLMAIARMERNNDKTRRNSK